jgi:geranylgeranyl diphosphate synthase type II
MLNFDQMLLKQVEEKLRSYVQSDHPLHKELFSSMEYSLMAGGKRLRPMLLLRFCSLCDGDVQAAMPFACALEMIHTYSLIHDDLPCMDDDDLRRGKPTNHKIYGEGLAVLAGDALQALAFDIMLRPETVEQVGAERAARAAGILAQACGAQGMCGGQAIDLASEGKHISMEVLQEMDREKTGALILAAARMGCELAGAGKKEREAAEEYAACIGLSFQIVDDLLDVCGETDQLGKTTGSDVQNEKSTYVSLLGVEKAREYVQKLTRQAQQAAGVFGCKADMLVELAQELEARSF